MKRTFSYRLNIFLFLLPALILFVGILIVPIFVSFYDSLFSFSSFGDPNREFVAFDNYVTLFTSKIGVAANDKFLGEAILNALLLAGLSVFIQLPLALLIAMRLGKGIRGERTYLSIFFMPVLISTVIIGQMWLKIYDPKYGMLNAALQALGADKWLFPWITSQLPNGQVFTGQWTGFRQTALFAVFIPTIWQYLGYHMLLMYAGIKGVPTDLLEAGRLDGCTEGQINRYIIIPYIRPVLRVSVIFAVTGSLKSFDLVYNVLKDTRYAELPSTLLYKLGFKHNLYGVSSAIAVILIVLCFAFALLISFIFRDKGDKVA